MNWKIILLLSLLGIGMAIASIFGLINTKFELIYWLVLALISGFVIAKTCHRSIFIHGVMVGLLSGILGALIQSIFFDTYLKNNPTSLDGFKQLPMTLAPQYVLLFVGPFIGIAYGIVVGLIALILKKAMPKNTNK